MPSSFEFIISIFIGIFQQIILYVKERDDLLGGVIPGQVVAGAVVEQVSQKQQAVGLLPFKGLLQLLRIIIGTVQV